MFGADVHVLTASGTRSRSIQTILLESGQSFDVHSAIIGSDTAPAVDDIAAWFLELLLELM